MKEIIRLTNIHVKFFLCCIMYIIYFTSCTQGTAAISFRTVNLNHLCKMVVGLPL